MKPTVLVVTTVHWPDDTRIRERLIRSLADQFEVVYAAKAPGPTDRTGLRYEALDGGRIRRNLAAVWLVLRQRWDVLVIHDPELVGCGLLARLARRRPVVFDVHEDVPATVYTREWVPGWLRRPLAAFSGWVLHLAERFLEITLAEPGYQRLFADSHPSFVNYPDTTGYPEVGGDVAGPVVYLGDVTIERGADVAVAACVSATTPLRMIGRIDAGLRERLLGAAGTNALLLEGAVPNREAVTLLGSSSVGLAPLRDLPNYRHSQPTKVLEYLAMGLPVVASDLPGTRTLTEGLDAVALVSPGDANELAAAITESRTPERLEQARVQAPLIRARFRWPSDEVVQFYRSLL